MTIKNNTILFVFIPLLCCFTGCREHPSSFWEADISAVVIEPVSIHRYGKTLFELSQTHFAEEISEVGPIYAPFLGGMENSLQGQIQLLDFINNEVNQEAWKGVNKQYPTLTKEEQAFTTAFRYLKYYFPKSTLPTLYSYVSGFNYEHPIVVSDTIVLIALDCFLGSDFEWYGKLGIPNYVSSTMTTDYLLPKAMHQIGESKYIGHLQYETLIEGMINAGKVLFFSKLMLPETEDHLLFNYSINQLKWCINNEPRIWSVFIENDYLFSTDIYYIKEFLGPSATTKGFPNASPGRLGAYIGFKIVENYMRNNPSVTLDELFLTYDYNTILQHSKYKP